MENNNLVFIKQERVLTSSKILAEKFGKRHSNVLAAIERILPNLSNDFNRLHYQAVEFIEENAIGGKVVQKYYDMTRDGMIMVAMGFTGAKAIAFKEHYIQAFNAMEASQARRGRSTMSVADMLQLASEEIRAKEAVIEEQKSVMENKPISLVNTNGMSMTEAFKEFPIFWEVAKEEYHNLLVERRLGKLNHAGVMTVYVRKHFGIEALKSHRQGKIYRSLYNKEDLARVAAELEAKNAK